METIYLHSGPALLRHLESTSSQQMQQWHDLRLSYVSQAKPMVFRGAWRAAWGDAKDGGPILAGLNRPPGALDVEVDDLPPGDPRD